MYAGSSWVLASLVPLWSDFRGQSCILKLLFSSLPWQRVTLNDSSYINEAPAVTSGRLRAFDENG